MIQADSHVQIDEIIGCQKLLFGWTFDDFDCELLADEMEDPPSLNGPSTFIVCDFRLEGLDLKLFRTSGGQLDCHILIEGYWHEIGFSGYLFLSVLSSKSCSSGFQ